MVCMRLLIDENVPEGVAELFRQRNHQVIYVRDTFGKSTPDHVIAAMDDRMEAVVVTWDADFKRLIGRAPMGSKAAFRKLGRISFKCSYPQGRARAEEFIEYIEREFQLMKTRADRRLLLEIGNSYFRILR